MNENKTTYCVLQRNNRELCATVNQDQSTGMLTTQMSTLTILTEKHALQIRGIPTMYLGHVSEQTKNNWGS